MDTVFEPLAETAALAHEFAAGHCDPARRCRSYHGVWQYLRLLGVNPAVTADRAFFISTSRTVARRSAGRVLISGSADYGMLAQLSFGFRAEGVEPDYVLADHCATPLEVNRDYARRAGLRLETIHGDIREVAVEPVDLICTHSFLLFFDEDGRHALARTWYDMLRPGGSVVTTNPLFPPGWTPEASQTKEEVERYRGIVVAAAAAHAGTLGVSPGQLADEAALMRCWMKPHGLFSLEELRRPFEAAGFHIEHVGYGNNLTEGQGPFSNPGRQANRAQIIATRLS
jgi:hypothetical protein